MVHWTPEPSITVMNSEQSLFKNTIDSKSSTILIPVEWAWRKGIIEHPEQQWLWPEDNVHPGPRRTYISAVSIYASIYRESPVGLPNIITFSGSDFIPCGTIGSFTPEDADYLQNLALWSINNYQIGK